MGPIANQGHSPLSIRLGGPNSAPYKSIDLVEWQDIPPFAVLTGPNGTGKTQLLQVLAYKFANIPLRQYPTLGALPFENSGELIGPHEIAYLPNAENAFRSEASSISTLHQLKINFLPTTCSSEYRQ